MQRHSAAPYLHLGPGGFAKMSIAMTHRLGATCCGTAYEQKKYLSNMQFKSI